MKTKPYEAAVVIGRFQIPHIGHIRLFQEAAKLSDKLVILVGSVGQPKTTKNPFSFDERVQMLKAVLPTNINYQILPVRDQQYNLQSWIVDVVNKVNSTLPSGWTDKPRKVALVGHKKDSSSFYLDLFPQWKSMHIEQIDIISASHIREELFETGITQDNIYLTDEIKKFLWEWENTEAYNQLCIEYGYLKTYKEAWKDSPFPPVFVTVDGVVIQSGHLLLVKRKYAPGKGLYALPGGFLDPHETLEQAVLRELREETKIHLQEIVLKRAITERRVYDAPDRSLRGRTVTHAFLFELLGHELPKIRGGSDAEKAEWIPLNEVYTMGEQLFEDHLDIILNITGNK